MYPAAEAIYVSVSHLKKRDTEKEMAVLLLVALPFICFSLETYYFFFFFFFFLLDFFLFF